MYTNQICPTCGYFTNRDREGYRYLRESINTAKLSGVESVWRTRTYSRLPRVYKVIGTLREHFYLTLVSNSWQRKCLPQSSGPANNATPIGEQKVSFPLNASVCVFHHINRLGLNSIRRSGPWSARHEEKRG